MSRNQVPDIELKDVRKKKDVTKIKIDDDDSDHEYNDEEVISIEDTEHDPVVPKVDRIGKSVVTWEPQSSQVFKMEGEKKIDSILVPPNIPTTVKDCEIIIKQIMKIVNGNEKVSLATAVKLSYVGRKLIKPGHVGIIQNRNTGKINIVPSGRWSALDPYCNWMGIYDINEDVIQVENLSIINVNNGKYGLATDNIYPIILSPGRHVRFSKVFTYNKEVEINTPYIKHKIIHLVNIPKGKLCKVFIEQKPYLLNTGCRAFVSSMFDYIGLEDEMKDIIKHGNITRIRVKLGSVALCWDGQIPVFFNEPGIVIRQKPTFNFVKCVDAKTKFYQLGARKNITVNSGEVGISFKRGKLHVLKPGLHRINDQYHIFDGFMSTKQRTIDLTSDKANFMDHRGFLECETKDLVKVGIKATLFYKVNDPVKAICEIGEEKEITTFLLDTAVACLNSIVRSTSLAEVGSSIAPRGLKKEGKEKKKEKEELKKNKEKNKVAFFDRAHDEFLFKLHDRFFKTYGLDIVDLRIESFKIISEELATQISRQAVVTAKTQTELANLEGQRKISTSVQKREAEVQRIKNEILTKKIEAETEAENKRLIKQAEAQAEKILIVARAKAKAMQIEAEAEAKARETRAKGEYRYVEIMNQLPLGRELALLNKKTEMIMNSLQNTQKVVYLDSNNPLGMFQTMLSKLGKVGELKGREKKIVERKNE